MQIVKYLFIQPVCWICCISSRRSCVEKLTPRRLYKPCVPFTPIQPRLSYTMWGRATTKSTWKSMWVFVGTCIGDIYILTTGLIIYTINTFMTRLLYLFWIFGVQFNGKSYILSLKCLFCSFMATLTYSGRTLWQWSPSYSPILLLSRSQLWD